VGSITLHNIPSSLYGLLKQKARREGKSMNRTIQDLLAGALGLPGSRAGRETRDVYDEVCGGLPAEEAARMLEAEKDLERIDPEDWR
jgi:hypothetical protein